jgi:hypothetical protein
MVLRRIETSAANYSALRLPSVLRLSETTIAILHLFALTAFAIAQPVYDRVGERPAFLTDMGIKPPAIVLIVVAFSLGVPMILAAGIWGIGRTWPPSRAPLQVVIIYSLLTAAGAPVTYRIVNLPDWMATGLALVAGAVSAWAYFHCRRVRSVVTVSAPAIIVFPAMFLLTSPVAREFFHSRHSIESTRWKPTPVVLVVLDELCGMSLVDEGREIDAVRFPHFAELAAGSTWLRNATANFPYTSQAVPTILSGKYPSTKWTPTVADRPQNLFSILNATGAYESSIFEPMTRLATSPYQNNSRLGSGSLEQLASIMPAIGSVLLHRVAPPGLRSQLPEFPKLWYGFIESARVDSHQRRGVFRYAYGDDRLGQFNHFLSCLDDWPRPQLYFFHVFLPHSPWSYLPSGRRHPNAADVVNETPLVADRLFVEQCQQRYLLQLGFVDSQIGRLLDRLRETNLYDKSLLIVTADHGITFKVDVTRRAVTESSRPDIMSVPLFIKVPGQRTGAINDKNIESVDILPTIAEVLEIDLQLPVDGRSVFSATAPERRDKILHTDETLGGTPIRVPADILNSSSVPQELQRRFGSASDPDALFRIGPHPDLIGRRVADLPRGAGPRAEIALDPSTDVSRARRKSVVFCSAEGRVVVPAVLSEPLVLAIAVNGTIRATTRTYEVDSYRDLFRAMLPESAFEEGANDVQYFTVSGSAPDVRLTPCIRRGSTAK